MFNEKDKSQDELLGEINVILSEAVRLVDRAARLCKSSGLDRNNVITLANGMQEIFSVQAEIYKRRPELTPDYLKDRKRHENRE